MDYTQITDEQEQTMLEAIGVERLEDLFAPIPRDQRLQRPLDIPLGCSELELLAELEGLARRNRPITDMTCFAGCGAYDHFIPTVVDHLAMRGEFLTAYTPYQAEASQGTLQAFYEFQTMICQLTGMDIANASLYEAASAAAEAAMMALGANGRRRIIVADTCHPDTLETITTYAEQQRVTVSRCPMDNGLTDVRKLTSMLDETVSAVIFQFPNFFGQLEDMPALIDAIHAAGALAIVSYDPIASGALKRPGDCGADIVVGEGQALGIPLQYGAPYLGFFATREQFLRKLPGRMVGVTHDAAGNRGYTLVLQTREQHIKRERATSNVCTNQGLMAMRATVYLAAMGKVGIRKVASRCLDKAHYAASEIEKLDGYALRFAGPFFKEFVVRTSKDMSKVMAVCRGKNILAGVPLGRWFDDLGDCFTVAVTEKRTKEEIDALVDALDSA